MRASLPALMLAAAVATVVLYGPALEGEFVWDDRAAVVNNREARWDAAWASLSSTDFWGQRLTLATSHKSWRPLTTLTYRLDNKLHGLEPRGYHLSNLVVHALACCAACAVFARVVFRDRRDGGRAAAVASLLFALHPIHSEPAASVVGRADALCGLMLFGGLVAYDQALRCKRGAAPSAALLALAHALAALALFSKEIGIMTWPLFVVRECVGAMAAAPPHRGRPAAAAAALVPTAADAWLRVSACVCAVAVALGGHLALHGGAAMREWTVLENDIHLLPRFADRALNYAHVHARCLHLLVAPFRLCFDYGYQCIPRVAGFLDPLNALAAAAYGGVAAACVGALARRSTALVWGLALLVVPFLPAAHVFFPVGAVLAERLLYVPSAGACAVLALAVSVLDTAAEVGLDGGAAAAAAAATTVRGAASPPRSKRDKKRAAAAAAPPPPPRRGWRTAARAALRVGLAAYLAAFARTSRQRAHDWQTELSLFRSARRVCPRSLKVLNNFALVAMQHGSAETSGYNLTSASAAALELLDTAVALSPVYPSAVLNRGLAKRHLDRHVDALADFELCYAQDEADPSSGAPYAAKCHLYAGQQFMTFAEEYERVGDVGAPALAAIYVRAASELDAALALGSRMPLLHHCRGSVAYAQGDYPRASHHLNAALVENRNLRTGDTGRWGEDLVREPATLNMLGLAYREVGQIGAALSAFEEGLALSPNDHSMLSNAASLAADQGDIPTASRYYEAAIRAAPQSLEVLNNYGYFNEQAGRLPEALALYRRAAAMMLPDVHPQIQTNIMNVEAKLVGG